MDWDPFFRLYLVVGMFVALLNTGYSYEGFMGIATRHGKSKMLGWALLLLFFECAWLFWPIIVANRVTKWSSKF